MIDAVEYVATFAWIASAGASFGAVVRYKPKADGDAPDNAFWLCLFTGPFMGCMIAVLRLTRPKGKAAD